MKRIILSLLFFLLLHNSFSQEIILKDVLKPNRDKLYRNIIRNSINANLSFPLTDSTEERWQDAFWSLELINYKSPWVNNRIRSGIDGIQTRSFSFQRAILELIYVMYPQLYMEEVKTLSQQTNNPKVFVMCVLYLLKNNKENDLVRTMTENTAEKLIADKNDPILKQLYFQLSVIEEKNVSLHLQEFLEKKYFSGNVLMISFQRKNRDYPGLVMVRDVKGNFVKEADGSFFAVPQLARSITNLPGYLTNGNTPEGIFRMHGFDQSKSSFIGPTNNIQLTMPFEAKATHFYRENSLNENYWDIDKYKNLLPVSFRNYFPLQQSFYAGQAGRTEIIAHGTTFDPQYYKGTPYYPINPTQGCLSTKEIWSDSTGKLLESDQLKLSNAIVKAGGPEGYAIVINIDDKQEPVTLDEILPFLKLAGQN